ncbi:MAG: hypothetical protein LBI54_00930, partial [Lachnospiraceae bacterium]|nr:hypothetical protein [Lachnospiraceae bacterium]
MKRMKKRILSTLLTLVLVFSLLPANTVSITTLATAGDLVGNGDPSLVGEGLAPPAGLDGADIADPDNDASADGTEPPGDDDPAETGETDRDDPADDGKTDADTETDPDDVGAVVNRPPTAEGDQNDEAGAPLETAVSAAPSTPNDDAGRLAKFLDPDAIVPIDPEEAGKDWQAIDDLAGLQALSDGNYYLTADIDLGNEEWAPLSFSGTLDGQGYVIKNFKITDFAPERGYYGFFSNISGTAIRNLGLEGFEISLDLSAAGTGYAYNIGGLVGQASADSEISNCYVEGSVTVSQSPADVQVGGLAGDFSAGNISASKNSATVSAQSTRYAYAGGIAGDASGSTVSACENTGAVTAAGSGSYSAYAGGIAGLAYGSAINDCRNGEAGSVSASLTGEPAANSGTAYAGGIFGNAYNNVTISDCANKGDVTVSAAVGNASAGGVGGSLNDGNVSACTNEGDVSASLTGATLSGYSRSALAGGIFGRASGIAITSCLNKGDVAVTAAIGSAYAGGIAGDFGDSEPMENCTNEGAVTASLTGMSASNNSSSSAFAGGIVGSIYRSGVTGCTNKGAVAATNSATVEGNNLTVTTAGGIAGETNQDVTISGCQNESTATVTATLTGAPPVGNERRAYAGGVCGHTENGTEVENCSNAGAVTLSAAFSEDYSNIAEAGGVIGYANNTTVSECSNTGGVTVTVTGEVPSTAGGIIGSAQNTAIDTCQNSGDVTAMADKPGYAWAGGICGNKGDNVTITNCANTGTVTPEEQNPNFPTRVYPLDDTDGWTAIADAAGLIAIGATAESRSARYYLTADIDLGGAEWAPISGFEGTLDGQGYAIKNFKITNVGADEYSFGLFSYVSGATIKNLGLADATINLAPTGSYSSFDVGALAGNASQSSIYNCYSEASVSFTVNGSDAYIGGFVGFAGGGSLDYCANYGNVTAANSATENNGWGWLFVGGVLGQASSQTSIYECTNEGAVSANAPVSTNVHAGGIAGRAYNVDLDYSHNYGPVSAVGAANVFAGGVCGYSSPASINGCRNSAAVSATGQATALAGGIAGGAYSYGNIENCQNTGAVSATSSSSDSTEIFAGGIAGNAVSATIRDCKNTGAAAATVSGQPTAYENGGSAYRHAYAGGIAAAARDSATIEGCTNEGSVTASNVAFYSARAGGIAGNIMSGVTIDDCENKGAVQATVSGGAGLWPVVFAG